MKFSHQFFSHNKLSHFALNSVIEKLSPKKIAPKKLALKSLLIAGAAVLSMDAFAEEQKRILMVVSSYGERSEQGELIRPGYEMSELARAYQVFDESGLEIDIASPRGGLAIEEDYDKQSEDVQAFIQDDAAMEKVANTFKLSAVSAAVYDAIYIVGGKGPMYDLIQDPVLQTLVKDIYQNNGIVGAVCHGPAGLVNVKLDNDEYLVSGKRVNSFTNQEETIFESKWRANFPFLLEDQLKKNGAVFESSPFMLEHVTVDQRLVTGQNPTSTYGTAVAMVEQLGLATPQTELTKMEQTFRLVKNAIEQPEQAASLLDEKAHAFDTKLVTFWGFFQIQNAKDQNELANGVALTELGRPFFTRPVVDFALAEAWVKLGNKDKAAALLKSLLEDEKFGTKSSELLASL